MEYKIILIGDSGSGKSSLITKFTDDKFESRFASTIGIDFRSKTFKLDDQTITLHIWDTAGQEKFRSITRSYYSTAKGVILVFDLSSVSSFNSLNKWLNEIIENVNHECPIILVGTKNDLKIQVSRDQVSKFLESYDTLDIEYIETSSKNGMNVNAVFFSLSEKLLKNRQLFQHSNNDVDLEKTNQSYSCCWMQ